MRIRTIKPEFWADEKLSRVSEFAHLLAAALLNYADDEGYFNANHRLVECSLFPLREPSMSIHGAFIELSNVGYLQIVEQADGRKLGKICNFTKHQVICRPAKSRFAAEFELGTARINDDSMSVHGEFTDDSLAEQGTGNREQGIKKETKKKKMSAAELPLGIPVAPKKFTPPTAEQVREYADWYCADKGIKSTTFDADRFVNHYESIGWVIGKNRTPMKSWTATVKDWLLRELKSNTKAAPNRPQQLLVATDAQLDRARQRQADLIAEQQAGVSSGNL